jgi:hypothetical protein
MRIDANKSGGGTQRRIVSAVLFCFVFFIFTAPLFVLASQVNINYTPLAPIPNTTETGGGGNITSLGTYLRGIYITGVALAGLFAVFSIVRGGFSLLFTDSVLGKLEGKGIILHAIGGLLVVFASFVLLNTINPGLAKDLNLNMDLIRRDITPYQGRVAPVTLTDAQFQRVKEVTAERDVRLRQEVAELRADAEWYRTQAYATSDDEERAVFHAQAEELDRQAANLELSRVTVGGKNLASGEAMAADTSAEAATAVASATGSGGTISQIRDGYVSAHTSLAVYPEQELALYQKEMSDISGIHKQLAFSLIDFPPNDPNFRRVIGAPTPNDSIVVDKTALTQQLSSMISSIISERDKQKGALYTFNGRNPTLQSQTLAQMRAIEKIAEREICQVKSKCRQNSYGYSKTKCEELRPEIICIY